MNAKERKERVVAALQGALRVAERAMGEDVEAADSLVEQLKQEHRRAMQQLTAMTTALCSDEAVPVSVFRAFASRAMFRIWERNGRLVLARKNGKLCAQPSVFFTLWRELKDKPRRSRAHKGPLDAARE